MTDLALGRLRVYQAALAFVAWGDTAIATASPGPVLTDQFERAASSIVMNIAEANGHPRSSSKRRLALSVAYGSALECAACLDIAHAYGGMAVQGATEGKRQLADVVAMLLALRDRVPDHPGIREDEGNYRDGGPPVFFSHERLDVYQVSLSLTKWAHELLQAGVGRAATRDLVERALISLVLNIAEGNGRFGAKDRMRFLDTAYSAALKAVAALDVWAIRSGVEPRVIQPGKEQLTRVVAMLVGLRRAVGERGAPRPGTIRDYE